MENAIPDFQKIALDLQKEMQAAIAEAEKLGQLALADTEAAADAQIEKADVLRRCETQARETVEGFFSKNKAELSAKIREELLADAARKLRNAGKPSGEIAQILGVELDFVEKSNQVK